MEGLVEDPGPLDQARVRAPGVGCCGAEGMQEGPQPSQVEVNQARGEERGGGAGGGSAGETLPTVEETSEEGGLQTPSTPQPGPEEGKTVGEDMGATGPQEGAERARAEGQVGPSAPHRAAEVDMEVGSESGGQVGTGEDEEEGGEEGCSLRIRTTPRRKNRPCSLPVSQLETVIASACGEPETPRSHYIRIHRLLHSLPSAQAQPEGMEDGEGDTGEAQDPEAGTNGLPDDNHRGGTLSFTLLHSLPFSCNVR